eukprot:1012616_1
MIVMHQQCLEIVYMRFVFVSTKRLSSVPKNSWFEMQEELVVDIMDIDKPKSDSKSSDMKSTNHGYHSSSFINKIYDDGYVTCSLLSFIITILKLKHPIQCKISDMHSWLKQSIISMPSTLLESIPVISPPKTTVSGIVKIFLEQQFASPFFNRKMNVLTNSFYRSTSWHMHSTQNRYIPLKDINITGNSESANYLTTSPHIHALHSIIGDSILYFVLCNCTIFVTIGSPNHYFQLCGKPASDVVWQQKKNAKHTIRNKQKRKHIQRTKHDKTRSKPKQQTRTASKQTQAPQGIPCPLCNKRLTDEHILSAKHQSKLQKAQNIAPKQSFPVPCKICGCNKLFKTKNAFARHLKSKGHNQKYKRIQIAPNEQNTNDSKKKKDKRQTQRHSVSPSVLQTTKPSKSVLGKRKSLPGMVNPRRKYRRLNSDTSIRSSSRRSMMEEDKKPIIHNTHLRSALLNDNEVRRKGLKPKDSVTKQNMRHKQIKRYSMFYGGKNLGQHPILSQHNLLNILPPSNFGAELLIRHIFFKQTLQWFKEKETKLITQQGHIDRKKRRRNARRSRSKSRSISLSQSSFTSSISRSNSLSQTPLSSRSCTPTPNSTQTSSTYSTSTTSSSRKLRGKNTHRINRIKGYVPSRRIVRLFGGKIAPRYMKLIPFFKQVLMNYAKMKWHQFKHLIEGTIQEKKDTMYWLKLKDHKRNAMEDIETASRASTGSILSSSPDLSGSTITSDPCKSRGLSQPMMSTTNPLKSRIDSLPLTQMAVDIKDRYNDTNYQDILQPDLKTKLTQLVSYHRSFANMIKFIKTLMNRLFRHDHEWGFGSDANRRRFARFLKKLVVGQRHQKFNMFHATHKIQPIVLHKYMINEHKYPRNTQVNEINWHITLQFMWWLMNDVLMDALRFNFYVTERSYTQGPVVTYYPSKIWKQINQIYLKQNKGMFEPISKGFVWKMKQIQNGKTTNRNRRNALGLGIGFLRFVPKPSSLRPIINLSRNSVISDPSDPKHTKTELIAPNKKLLQLFAVLTDVVTKYKEANRKEDIFGSSVFCVPEYYTNWSMFCAKYKELKDNPKIYAVSADLSKCYDRVNQSKLMEIVKYKLLFQNEYKLLKYSEIKYRFNSIFQKYKYAVDCLQIQDLAKASRYGGKKPFILCNEGYQKTITKEALFKIMKDHITTSIVYLNGRYYKHNVGIPQGSILSQLLCCVYIGQFEKQIRKQIALDRTEQSINVCRLMMRHVDDFIFFTTNKQEAETFKKILHSTNEEFNMMANRSKTTTNDDSEWISWCGFIWNTRTLNVRVDHRKHTLNIRANLLTSSLNASGEYLLSKLQQLARHKITPLLLSTEINETSNVIYNLYQLFIITGFRFVRLVIHLEFKNEKYLLQCLHKIVKYVFVSVKEQKMPSIKKCELEYVAFRAYDSAINPKYHGLFSRAFRRKIHKMVTQKRKWNRDRFEMFEKYTDRNELMHERLNEFVY